jgi:hypothetical protein
MTTPIDLLLASLPEDQRAGVLQTLNSELEHRVARAVAAQSTPQPPPTSSPPMNSSSSSSSSTSSIVTNSHPIRLTAKVQIPESFGGQRMKVEQFIVQLRRYMLLSNVYTLNNIEQVQYAAQFLIDQALIWFESVQKSDAPIMTLGEFENRLRLHFLPYGVEKIARTKLRQLTQLGSVQAYSTLFIQTVQHISTMHIDDQIETYIVGLKPHVYKEVVTKDWKTLHECMDYAAFIEARVAHRIPSTGGFRSNTRPTSVPFMSPTGTTSNHTSSSTSTAMDLSNIESSLNEVDESNGAVGTNLYSIQGNQLKKLTDAERQRFRKEGRCFRCRQIGHIASNPACPKYQQPPKPSIN